MSKNRVFKTPKLPNRRKSVHITSSEFLCDHGILSPAEINYNENCIYELGLAITGSVRNNQVSIESNLFTMLRPLITIYLHHIIHGFCLLVCFFLG